jgi:hypothetical protein
MLKQGFELFQGSFEEDDDDDEDEDEALELMNYHPSSDKHQGFGSKEQSHQELLYGDQEAKEHNSNGSKDYDTKKKVFDNNVVSRYKLLANTKPWSKDFQTELQSAKGDCLQPEREIIEEGSKKLLQIHNKFLSCQHNPPLQPIGEPTQQEFEAFKDSNCFSNDYHKPQQHLKGEETLNSSLNFPISKFLINNKEKNGLVVFREAQQSHCVVEDASLSTQRDFISLVSKKEEKQQQPCFAILSKAKVAATKLNANLSTPNFSTGFEEKGCIESLANDQGSDIDSTNSGNEVIHDVMTKEKEFKIDEQKEDQFITERTTAEASIQIPKVEEVVQQMESIVPVIQMETTQSKKNWGSEITDRIKDWQIETTIEYRQAEYSKPFSHVFEENHVDLMSKVQEIEPTSPINVGRTEQIDKHTRDVEETQLIEKPLKQCANATSLEEANRRDDLIVAADDNKGES